MTDPMCTHWTQPSREEITVDAASALMFQHTLDKLHEYTDSVPSGAYVGKMWKRMQWDGGWLLCWFAPCSDPNLLKIEKRKVILL